MKDYTGKKIYLGIDVHKATYAVTALCEKIVAKKATLQANPEGLVTFCKKFFPGATIESAYEAGFSGFHLHRVLEKNGITNLVVHAAGIEVAVGDRVKTDKRDSLKIATQLEANRLRGIHVPSEEREEKRALTRLRDTVVEHRTTTSNQIKALLHQHGLRILRNCQ
jgi:transposase